MKIIINSNINQNEINDGGRIEYEGLQAHMEYALKERGMDYKTAILCPEIALFSNAYYDSICKLRHQKKYDFCFIGSINSNYEERRWVLDFAKKHFTNNSIFINTDTNPTWNLLGKFDLSNKNIGFCPKENNNYQSKKIQYRPVESNKFYFETMTQSKYVLCPAGDAPWSFRFYETLLCHSIPILKSEHHSYRTQAESKLKYSFIVIDIDSCEFNQINETLYSTIIKNNTTILNQNHFLSRYESN
jgi:hypothetical protein